MHTNTSPSDWILRWTHLVPSGGAVLDVACGQGRHVRHFHARKHPVTAVDKSAAAIDAVAHLAHAVCADIEAGPWPFRGSTFAAVIVTHYLWRPLLPTLVQSVAPGGVLLYETFAAGQESIGKPSRPDFLLQAGELLRACAGLHTVAFEDGFEDNGQQPARFVQRIAAVRARAPAAGARYPLAAPATHLRTNTQQQTV